MRVDQDLKLAVSLATTILAQQSAHPTEEAIQAVARKVADGLVPAMVPRVAELISELESRFNVQIGVATQLVDTSHTAWLPARKAEINWRYWNRYRHFLVDAKQLPPSVVDAVEESVDSILGLLTDPLRPGEWDRRGLVVGHVQSGKTSNYTGLICKAVDAGYRVIVVLAGVHDSLRSQTQQRLDEGFLGFDSVAMRKQANGPIPLVGVAKYDPACPKPNTVTTRRADFSRQVANQFLIQPSHTLLFVVKKNASVLKNLQAWVQRGVPPDMIGALRPFVRDTPLLVIDDEADHSSVDTKAIPLKEDGTPDPEHNPTTINRSIRKLLHSFQKAAYVGYTATPFANIYIHESAATNEHGPDLFPRSFIVNLPAPTNYVGPTQIFGLARSENPAGDESDGLPLIRLLADSESWIPNGHRAGLTPGPIPASLREAIHAFALTCAGRMVRGDGSQHNSMLVHVTRFTDVQSRVVALVKSELKSIQQRLRHGDGHRDHDLRKELKDLWGRDFVATTERTSAPDCRPIEWAEIDKALLAATEKIEVRTINGKAGDVLDYVDQADVGISVIAIGGDKLSRGLTLEGLSVSYYLRASRMYDTLMQMGRWFGYRPKYLDLCRLYTTPELVEWYEHITEANEELRELFDQMALSRATPEEFGIRVKSHPDLLVTGAVKMRNGHKLQLTYAGDITETIGFYRDTKRVEQNYEDTDKFIHSLGNHSRILGEGGKVIWSGVSGERIVNDFLANIKVHPSAYKARPELLAQYIRQRIPHGELVDWTVVLVSAGGPTLASHFGYSIGLPERANHPANIAPEQLGRYGVRRLLSRSDEWIDLTEQQYQEALERTIDAYNSGQSSARQKPATPSGLLIREVRERSRGLLLIYPLAPHTHVESDKPVIGFAISFPGSEVDDRVSYVVNNVYYQQEFSFDES